jgi:hypothetical protein
VALLCLLGTSRVFSTPVQIPSCLFDIRVDSGILSNPSSEPAVVYSTAIRVPGASGLTLFFQKVILPPDPNDPSSIHFSRVQITSLLDGDSAGMSSGSIKEFGFGSPFFNGEAVRVELVAAPNSEHNQFVIDGVLGVMDPEGRDCIPPQTRFRRGDANSDGVLDISDPLAILQRLFLEGDGCFCTGVAFDSNDDDKVDISDAIQLLDFLFLGTSEDLPEPFLQCGTDPTPGSLRLCIFDAYCGAD